MNVIRLTIVCVTVLGYASGTSQRNVTYFLNDVCRRDAPGLLAQKSLQKHGQYLKEKTRQWLGEMSDILERWGGTEPWRDRCTADRGKITVQGKYETVPLMFFLEYITTLEKKEEKKVKTMLFHNCSENNGSVYLWHEIKTHLCHLLDHIDGLEPDGNNGNTDKNLCMDVIQKTNIIGVMKHLADFGKCLNEATGVTQCTHKLELFKRSGKGKTERRRVREGKGRKGKGRKRGKGKGRKRGKGSRKRGGKGGRRGGRKAGRKGQKRN